jgi:WG containing repeat
MLKKSLFYVLGALMLILWAGQPVQSQSTPGIPLKKKTCGDLWPVKQGDKWGYIDQTGRLIIPFKFDGAYPFAEGLASVDIKEKTGYIDATGKFVIPPRFLAGFPFSGGLALVILRRFEQNRYEMNQMGYIDRSGQVVIRRPETLDSKSFMVIYRDGDLTCSEGMVRVERQNKVGFMDQTGRQVIPPRYDGAGPFSEGLAAVKLGDTYGYLDRSGKMVIPPQFSDAGPFSDGLAEVSFNEKQEGYIDRSGKLVIKAEGFGMSRGFSEGLAAARGKNERYGFIDKTGRFVIPPQFAHVGDFSEGLAAVEPVDGPWPGNLAYVNHQGHVVIKSMSTVPDRPSRVEFDLHYYRFCGGVAKVSLGKDDDRDAEGYINREGKFIWPPAAPSQQKSR